MELTSRGVAGQAARTLLDEPRNEPSHPHARRRTTLADLRRDLQRQEDEKPDQHRRTKAALAVYTLARVAANVWFLLRPSSTRYSDDWSPDTHLILDSILRPLITGLGVFAFLHRKDRFSTNNPLQVWSFVAAFCLTLPLGDLSGEEVL